MVFADPLQLLRMTLGEQSTLDLADDGRVGHGCAFAVEEKIELSEDFAESYGLYV